MQSRMHIGCNVFNDTCASVPGLVRNRRHASRTGYVRLTEVMYTKSSEAIEPVLSITHDLSAAAPAVENAMR